MNSERFPGESHSDYKARQAMLKHRMKAYLRGTFTPHVNEKGELLANRATRRHGKKIDGEKTESKSE